MRWSWAVWTRTWSCWFSFWTILSIHLFFSYLNYLFRSPNNPRNFCWRWWAWVVWFSLFSGEGCWSFGHLRTIFCIFSLIFLGCPSPLSLVECDRLWCRECRWELFVFSTTNTRPSQSFPPCCQSGLVFCSRSPAPCKYSLLFCWGLHICRSFREFRWKILSHCGNRTASWKGLQHYKGYLSLSTFLSCWLPKNTRLPYCYGSWNCSSLLARSKY